jgi:small subunit ribosomal protein S29
VNSSSTYTYDMRTQVYAQPTFARQTLLRFLTVNRRHLDGLVTSREVAVERRDLFPAGTPLVELINVGVKDQGVAPTVLDAVLAELGTQKKCA